MVYLEPRPYYSMPPILQAYCWSRGLVEASQRATARQTSQMMHGGTPLLLLLLLTLSLFDITDSAWVIAELAAVRMTASHFVPSMDATKTLAVVLALLTGCYATSSNSRDRQLPSTDVAGITQSWLAVFSGLHINLFLQTQDVNWTLPDKSCISTITTTKKLFCLNACDIIETRRYLSGPTIMANAVVKSRPTIRI